MNTTVLLQTKFHIPAQHPCLTGHFPSYPIVPGVVLLEHVEKLILEKLTTWQITELSQVKFIAKVFPEDIIEIKVDLEKLTTRQAVTFNLQNITHNLSHKLVASGKFKLSSI